MRVRRGIQFAFLSLHSVGSLYLPLLNSCKKSQLTDPMTGFNIVVRDHDQFNEKFRGNASESGKQETVMLLQFG